MKFLTIDEIAPKWNVGVRRVQLLCAAGKIQGAVRFGRDWMIPEDAQKPVDGRTRAGRMRDSDDMPLPRKTPFLYMSDLFRTPGEADRIAAQLSYNHEAQVLFEAEVAYSRGEIDKVYDSANYLLGKHSGFYAVLSAGMLLAMCAIWKGDIEMWRRAKVHISDAPAKNDDDRDVMQLAISAVDIMLYVVENFPEWFKIGCFEPLHKDAFPAAKVYYAKYLYAVAYAVATEIIKIEGVQGLYLMSAIPNTIEPLICWANANGTVMSEIYLRLTCAAVYHNAGQDEQAIRHIDRAISLALPDRLYKRYNEGWSRLSGAVRGRTIVTSLTTRQREIAKLAAFGMSNKEIADKLNMSLAGVKQALVAITDKTGVGRDRFAAFL